MLAQHEADDDRQMRNKWSEDLEDLLQCPICMVRPKEKIFQCAEGHLICDVCKMQLANCPMCSKGWSAVRNRLAESLCIKLDNIKLSLLDPMAEVNKVVLPTHVSVACQTEGEVVVAAAAAQKPDHASDHTGAYHCRVGGCDATLFYVPMIKHMEALHPTQYIQIPAEGNVFQNIWYFTFVEQMTFDRVFTVPTMGTFFLKLSSDVFGNFTGFLLMLHNGFVAKQFTYQLEIACCAEHNTSMSYTGEMCSCRTPSSVLREKSLNVKRPDIQRMLDHTKNLACTVLLTKNSAKDEPNAPNKHLRHDLKASYPKKNYSKNINHTTRPANAQNVGSSVANQRFARPRTAPDGHRGSRDGSRQSRKKSPNALRDPPPPLMSGNVRPPVFFDEID